MFELYAYKVGMGIDIFPQQHSSEIPELLIQEVTEQLHGCRYAGGKGAVCVATSIAVALLGAAANR